MIKHFLVISCCQAEQQILIVQVFQKRVASGGLKDYVKKQISSIKGAITSSGGHYYYITFCSKINKKLFFFFFFGYIFCVLHNVIPRACHLFDEFVIWVKLGTIKRSLIVSISPLIIW